LIMTIMYTSPKNPEYASCLTLKTSEHATHTHALQIINPPHPLSPRVRHPRKLEQQPHRVDLHVLLAEHLLGPLLALHGNLLGRRVVARNHLAISQKVLHDAVKVAKPVVHRHKVLPGHEARVVPLAPQRRLYGKARAAQETEVPARERVAVNVGQELAVKLLAHLHALGDGEVRVRIRAGAALVLHLVVAHEIREPDIGELGHPLAQPLLLDRHEVVRAGLGQGVVDGLLEALDGSGEAGPVVHRYEPVPLETLPRQCRVLAARAHAAPDDIALLLLPRGAVVVATRKPLLLVPVHGCGQQDLVGEEAQLYPWLTNEVALLEGQGPPSCRNQTETKPLVKAWFRPRTDTPSTTGDRPP